MLDFNIFFHFDLVLGHVSPNILDTEMEPSHAESPQSHSDEFEVGSKSGSNSESESESESGSGSESESGSERTEFSGNITKRGKENIFFSF